jgi:dihydroorotase
MSERPAEIFSLKGKGKIKAGYLADITIIDPKKEWQVEGSTQYTKCRWSPFDGKLLKGKAHTVIKGGKIIFEDYQFV